MAEEAGGQSALRRCFRLHRPPRRWRLISTRCRAAIDGSIKFDGYRVQTHLANENVTIFTRRGHDWTRRFKKVADDARHISAASAIIDGEIVVPSANGGTHFSVLQKELRGKSTKIVLVAFNLLYLNGRDLRKLPLTERKAVLRKLVAGTAIQFSERFEVDGPQMFAHACKIGLKAW